MLNVHCNTVPRGRGKEKSKRSHIHWHVNIQAGGICSRGSVNLINKLGTSLGHKTNIPVLGSKQRLNLQGQHESLAGEGGYRPSSCSGACSCSLQKRGAHRGSRGLRRPVHVKRGGTPRLEGGRHGHPTRTPLPHIQPTPPNLSKAPFTVCSLK